MNHTSPYAIGDLQGCAGALDSLLESLPATASVRLVGDIVNRGPESLRTLRMVRAMGTRARTVLGNHDIHLLALAAGLRRPGKSDTLDDILAAPDRDELLTWLRHQPLAIEEDGFLLVHAGVLPQWTTAQVLDLAGEVEQALQGPNWQDFLANIFGNSPTQWHDSLRGMDRLRVVVNALTRLRYCSDDGDMDFVTKEGPDHAPAGYQPWFDVPGRRTAGESTIVCGHWSTLGLVVRPDLIALDTGCVWGGSLSAVQLARAPADRTVVQLPCPMYRKPGKD